LNADARAARAGLAVAAVLLALALPRESPSPAACASPSEVAAEAGHTRAVGCSGGLPLRGPARLLYGEALDLNGADAASLEALPGIGPARAAAIVAARPFASVAELARVPGIGPATLARIAPHLRVAP
jgi:hypothetical protein